MPIDYERVMALQKLGQKHSYSDRDAILYALSIGMGEDPLDERELEFVNEAAATKRPLKVVPTFASVAAGFAEPGDMKLHSIALDGERDISFHKPLTPAAAITADSSVIGVYDKGKDKGAVIRFRSVLKGIDGEPIASLVTSHFARGDGGFGKSSEGEPRPHHVPSRSPDLVMDIKTRPDQGLLYRLCGVDIRSIPIRRAPDVPASRGPSSMACAPMGSLAVAF